ncbi:MAG: hypothetical protein EON87_15415 [Brevundimonas sp.]|nr:MAG: hypothetical protein EON87_15415 [Brevundimonas sp.]
MRIRSLALAIVFTAAPVTLATTARACAVVTVREPTTAERRTEARFLIEQATAIVDGEVVRPFTKAEPALVRVSRVLKGDAREFVRVGERTSCDIALTRPGTRLRLILTGGPDVFYLPVDYSNAVEEDGVLGSDRTLDWPYYPGD